jgi:hypothetical protein
MEFLYEIYPFPTRQELLSHRNCDAAEADAEPKEEPPDQQRVKTSRHR